MRNSTILNALIEISAYSYDITSRLHLLAKIGNDDSVVRSLQNGKLLNFVRRFSNAHESPQLVQEIMAKIEQLSNKIRSKVANSVLDIISKVDHFYASQEKEHHLKLDRFHKSVSVAFNELSKHRAEPFILKLNEIARI